MHTAMHTVRRTGAPAVRHTPHRASRLAVVCIALAVVTASALVAAASGAATAADPAIDATAAQATSWPGPGESRTVDVKGYFGPNLSGLSYVAGASASDDRLFAVRDDGRLYRLRQVGERWQPDTGQGWGSGKALVLPSGQGGPDAEGLVVRNNTAWVSVERDGAGALRPSILRVPLTGTDATVRATDEWSLARHYPDISPNLGPEAITLVPNEVLVEAGFRDEVTGTAFSPAAYPDQRGGGVFLVAVEAPGLRQRVDAFVLRDGGAVVKVASFANPVGLATDLDFDASTGQVWATCDDFCGVRAAVFEIDRSGRFIEVGHHRRPAGLPNQNFEGFTVAPLSRCVGGTRPVFWSNDANNSSHALWSSRLACPASQSDAAVTLTVTPVAARAGSPTVVDVAVRPATAAGRVTFSVGALQAHAPVHHGTARIDVGSFRTAGPRSWTATWTQGTRSARATGELDLARARSTLRAAKPTVTAKRGSRARVVVHLSAGASPTSGRVRVKLSASGRSRFVRAQVTKVPRRVGERRSTKLVIRTPRLTGRWAKAPVKVSVIYAGTAHTTPVRRTVKVRLR